MDQYKVRLEGDGFYRLDYLSKGIDREFHASKLSKKKNPKLCKLLQSKNSTVFCRHTINIALNAGKSRFKKIISNFSYLKKIYSNQNKVLKE